MMRMNMAGIGQYNDVCLRKQIARLVEVTNLKRSAALGTLQDT